MDRDQIAVPHSHVPNQYHDLPSGSLQSLAATVRSIKQSAIGWWYRCLEAALFWHERGHLVRALIAPLLAPHIKAISAGFSSAFYLQQIGDAKRRAHALGAPILHYILFGVREEKSPHPAFDVGFYRRNNPTQCLNSDPYLHYLGRRRDSVEPQNECESVGAPGLWGPDREAVLTVHHARGGGSSKLLTLYERHLAEKGLNVLRLRAVTSAPHLGVIDKQPGPKKLESEMVFDLSAGRRALVDFARQQRISRLLINHVVDRPPAIFDWIKDISSNLGCPYDVVLHDYFALCPRIDLVTGRGVCCDIAPPAVCRICVSKYGSEVEAVDVRLWRHRHLQFLAGADMLIAPSADLALRMRPYLPSKKIEIWHPEDDAKVPPERIPRLQPDEPLRVMILGGVNVSKGARVVRAVAEQALLAKAPVRFTIVGPSSESEVFRRVKVRVIGAYRPEDEGALIVEHAPHVAFFPAIWPETWSFVLTAALMRQLPIVAFNTGAPADRLRSLGRGHVLPLEMAQRPNALLEVFLKLRLSWVG